MLQNPRSKLAAWSKMHQDVLAARTFLLRATSRVIVVNILFRFLIFLWQNMLLCRNTFSKNVQVVLQVVNNKKVMAKPCERQICMETGVSVIQKLLEIHVEKDIVREVAWGDKTYLRKSTVQLLPKVKWLLREWKNRFDMKTW